MTMHANIPTVHTLSDSTPKETKDGCKQTDIVNPGSSKDPLVKPTTKVQLGNLHSDSISKPDNKHITGKETIRASRLNHEADTSRNDPPKKGKRPIVIKIADQSNRNRSGKDRIVQQRQRDRRALPTRPETAAELLPRPIVQELTTGHRGEQPAHQEKGDKAAAFL